MSNPNVTVDRHKYIGGSDLPTILGLNLKYNKSPYELALEKARIIPNKFKGNEFTKYGTVMEPLIRDFINSKYNANYREDTVIDSKRGYRGNTDGIDREMDIPIIEIKTFSGELDVDYYTPQCQFYMETFDQPACRLVGYERPDNFYTGIDFELENADSYFNFEFDPSRIVEYVLYRDRDEWCKIENRITAFKNGVGYLIENKNDYDENGFNQLFYGTDIISTLNKLDLIGAKLEQQKSIETEFKNLKDRLYSLFDENGIKSIDTGVHKFTRIAPTSYDAISIDVTTLEKEHPDIYQAYKIVKPTSKKGYILVTKKKDE